MTIKKFTGNTRDEAIQNAKNELGDSVVIMNVKEVRPKGVFGIFKTSTYEVTAALEDDATPVRKNPSAALGEGGHFDAVAGERGVVKHVEPKRPQPIPTQQTDSKADETALAEESLRSAFAAVNEVIQKNENKEYSKQQNSYQNDHFANAEDKRLDSLLPGNTPTEVRNPAYNRSSIVRNAAPQPEEDFVNLKDAINADIWRKKIKPLTVNL